MTLKNILIFALIFNVLYSCKNDPLNVKIESIKVDIGFINLDSTIVNSSKKQTILNHHLFQQEINDIYSYQLGYCLQIGRVSDTAISNSLYQFTHDPEIKKIEARIKEKFNNITSTKKKLIKAFKHLKYHFPKGKIPKHIVFMNSLFQSNAFCTENEIGIGLERYLGAESDVIKQLPSEPFYQWIKESMNNDYLERDALCSWIITHYFNDTESNLAEKIVKWGKILYLTEASFPDEDERIIIRYSKEDYDWAVKNELEIWKHLVDGKLLFKINELDQTNYLKEAPFTIGLSDKSPDRLGQYLGWKMVRNYMNKNNVNLQELIKTPYNTILQDYEIED